MADLKKDRAPRQAAPRSAAPAQKRVVPQPFLKDSPEQELKKLFDSPAREPSREELDPLRRLVYDANLYLNGYLEALKAAAAADGERPQAAHFNRSDVKGVGAA